MVIYKIKSNDEEKKSEPIVTLSLVNSIRGVVIMATSENGVSWNIGRFTPSGCLRMAHNVSGSLGFTLDSLNRVKIIEEE